MIRTKVLLAALITVTVASELLAAEPATVSLQGRLSEAGMPSDGPVTLRLSLFDDADPLIGSKVDLDGDGTTQGPDEDIIIRNVTVTDGLFETDFGPIDPSAFDGTPRFLQIEVDGTPLSRIPFRSSPGVAETLVSPDGSTQLVVTSGTGGVALGGDDAAARLDIRPMPTQTAGTIQSVSLDVINGRSIITRSVGFPATVLPGDVLLALSPDGQSRELVGMAINVNNGVGTIETDFVTSGTLTGWTLEVRQPLLRIGANQNPEAYADGQRRLGLVVTDDGRVGINTHTPTSELEINGELQASIASIAQAFIADGSITASDVSAGSLTTGSLDVNGTATVDALGGTFAATLTQNLNNVFGRLQLGGILIQWGRFDIQVGKAVEIVLPRSYASVGAMSIMANQDQGPLKFMITTAQLPNRIRIVAEPANGSVTPTSGSWIAIGQAP